MLWRLKLWFGVGTITAVLLGAAATIIPMRAGLRAFRELET
jgi:hypothetical protein